jgi:hypothetical protein
LAGKAPAASPASKAPPAPAMVPGKAKTRITGK